MAWTTFAALRRETAAWSAQQLDESDVVVEGQLVHMRRISRKCSFYDLAEHPSPSRDVQTDGDSASPPPAAERLEVILKIIDDELSIDDVDAIRHRVSVGDVVRVHGFLERGDDGCAILLHARDITTVSAWKDLHPGVPFMPVPTIRKDERSSSKTPSESGAAAGRARTEQRVDSDSNAIAKSPTAAPITTKTAHCKFWINSRTCQYGDKCELVHAGESELKQARAEWLQQRLHLKRLRAKHDDDPLDAHGKSGKQQRAQVFAEWLVAQFGREFLTSGSGVVDVAGGRGSVSFELWNKRKVPCTLIDPRPMKLSKQQFKFMKKLKEDKDGVCVGLVPQKLDLFNTTTFLETPENAALVANASVLVGMHPDEATDAIVDVALLLDKPFVVVPCCVFGHKFPHRTLPTTGSKVVSYEDLVAYLQAKHPSIEKAFLPFDGKNLVLFRRSSTVTASAAATTVSTAPADSDNTMHRA